MDNKIIGRFIPVGKYNDWAKPFFVLTKEPSDYLAPAWKGIMADGEKYHVIESAWEFEPIEWSGEGIPPVGIDIEYRFPNARYRSDFSRGKVLAYGAEKVFMEHWSSKNEFIQPLDNIEFRPLRSEADKKRENGVLSLAKAAGAMPFRYGETLSDGELLGSSWYELYDKIAAGEVAGIRID